MTKKMFFLGGGIRDQKLGFYFRKIVVRWAEGITNQNATENEGIAPSCEDVNPGGHIQRLHGRVPGNYIVTDVHGVYHFPSYTF